MFRKSIIIVFSILFLPLAAEISLHHELPVNIADSRKTILELEVREGFSEIEMVTVFFRQTGETTYSEKEMEAGSETNPFFTSIMTEFSNYPSNAEYFFVITSKRGRILKYPSFQPEINPYRITINLPQRRRGNFVLLAPDNVYSDVTDNFLIAISTFAISDDLDYNSIQIFFDGKDVTKKARIFTNTITYQVTNASNGEHSYFVKAKLQSGQEIESNHWNTNVNVKAFELPLNLTGRALLSMRYMNYSNNDNASDTDRSANFLLTFKGSQAWLKFRSKLYLSSLESSSYQPVNKYQMVFDVPHFELTLGDYSPTMNSFLLDNKNVMGFHSKLHFNSLRLLFTTGRINRKVDGKVVNDTTFTAGTFKQNNNTLRIEFGNPQGFQIGLGFAKNKDDIASLNEEYYVDPVDSTLIKTPNDNLILGSDFRLSLLNHRVLLGTEAAMSFYNDNIIDGPATDADSLDTNIPFNPEDFESIFVINESMVPFKPGKANLALKSYLRLYFYRNLFHLSYTNIGSSFYSLSANYLQRDVKIISINDNIMLMNNQLSMNFGLNLMYDNVNGTKDRTSSSTTVFTQLMYNPYEELNFNLSFNTNSSEDGFEAIEDYEGNSALKIQSNNVSFGTSYFVKQFFQMPTRFSVIFSNSTSKDDANNIFDYQMNNLTLSAKSSFEELPLTTTLSYTLTLNDNVEESVQETSNYNSFYIKGDLDLMDNRLKPYIDMRYTLYTGDIFTQSSQMFNLGGSFAITTNSSVSAETGLKFYQNAEESNSNYSRMNFKMKISQRF
ncbi:MAG: hypothetical protein K9N07_01725 [Candidatus Cloacimonetes bacterium]|nr:hypothetical protein [Candidatus Cloacimonadota bacterium]